MEDKRKEGDSCHCEWCGDWSVIIAILDGDALCQKCADAWCQGEGNAANERDRDEQRAKDSY